MPKNQNAKKESITEKGKHQTSSRLLLTRKNMRKAVGNKNGAPEASERFGRRMSTDNGSNSFIATR